MKPESLKQLAIYMGYKVLPADNICAVNKGEGGCWQYDPINNAEQCLELQHKLKIDVRPISSFWVASARGGNTSKGKTINEAVTNAAIAAIKE